jgi:hypothetical protein
MICCVSYNTKPEKMRTEKHAMNRSIFALNGRKICTRDAVRSPIKAAKRNGPRKAKSNCQSAPVRGRQLTFVWNVKSVRPVKTPTVIKRA